MAKKTALKHPREARFLLPIYYDYIKKELPRICKETGANYEEESKKMIESGMKMGDAIWDQLDRGLKLIKERFAQPK